MCKPAQEVWDETVGKDSYIGGGGAGDDIKKVGKNIETNLQNTAKGVGMILSGDWNNADRTLFDIATIGLTGGMSTAVNPDDATNIIGKQTQVERKVDEMSAQAAADAAAAVQAEIDAKNKQVSDMLGGIVGAQRRAPGRGLTLLGLGGVSGASSGTLLTPRA